jgi:hypothetical protein
MKYVNGGRPFAACKGKMHAAESYSWLLPFMSSGLDR